MQEKSTGNQLLLGLCFDDCFTGRLLSDEDFSVRMKFYEAIFTGRSNGTVVRKLALPRRLSRIHIDPADRMRHAAFLSDDQIGAETCQKPGEWNIKMLADQPARANVEQLAMSTSNVHDGQREFVTENNRVWRNIISRPDRPAGVSIDHAKR